MVLDVGTGDAKTAYRIARAEPKALVVGLDPAWQRMVATSVRSARKPARGGLANLLLVPAAIERAPTELSGVADEVLVLMPWGKLLRGLVLGEGDVCAGLAAVAKPGATLHVTIGTSIWRDPVPADLADLPEPTDSYVRDVLASRLRAHGWQVTGRELTDGLTGALASSWSRRLGADATERVLHLRARRVAGS